VVQYILSNIEILNQSIFHDVTRIIIEAEKRPNDIVMLQWSMTKHTIKKVLGDEEMLFSNTNEGVDRDNEESLAFSITNAANVLGSRSVDLH